MVESPHSPPLLETLAYKNYSLTLEEIANGRLSRMVNNGLQVLTLCNDGTGRSFNVAKELSFSNIPSVCLNGGLFRLSEQPEIGHLLYEINSVPNIGVILTFEEQYMYLQLLNQLKAFRYTSSSNAIHSLRMMSSTL